MASYHNVRLPVPTGIGALTSVEYKPPTAEGDEVLNLAKTSARGLFVRGVAAFLFATGILSFMAFLATINGVDKSKMFISGLGVVINSVAVLHYIQIIKIREFNVPSWMLSSRWMPTKAWNEDRAVAIEIMVDALRHSDWLITLIFLVQKLYFLINKKGPIMGSIEAACLTAVVMVLLGAIARIGTDEFWDYKRSMWLSLAGCVSYIGSIVLLVLLLVDLGDASKNIENGTLLRSFFLVWIGYPLVSAVSMLYRFAQKCGDSKYEGGYPEWLSTFKDVAYGLLDAWSKGVFALWTAYSVFDVKLFDNDFAVPQT